VRPECSGCELNFVCGSGAEPAELWCCCTCETYRVVRGGRDGSFNTVGYHKNPPCLAWLRVEQTKACRVCLNFGIKNKYQITEMPER